MPDLQYVASVYMEGDFEVLRENEGVFLDELVN